MAAAAAAMHLLAHHAEGELGVLLHRVLDRRVEARPARVAIELSLGGEEQQIAAGADEGPFALLLVQGTGEGTLGVRLAQHGELLGREQLAPFLRRLRHLERLGPSIGRLAPLESNTSRGKGRDGSAAQKNVASPNHDVSLVLACAPQARRGPRPSTFCSSRNVGASGSRAILLARTGNHVPVSKRGARQSLALRNDLRRGNDDLAAYALGREGQQHVAP